MGRRIDSWWYSDRSTAIGAPKNRHLGGDLLISGWSCVFQSNGCPVRVSRGFDQSRGDVSIDLLIFFPFFGGGVSTKICI